MRARRRTDSASLNAASPRQAATSRCTPTLSLTSLPEDALVSILQALVPCPRGQGTTAKQRQPWERHIFSFAAVSRAAQQAAESALRQRLQQFILQEHKILCECYRIRTCAPALSLEKKAEAAARC